MQVDPARDGWNLYGYVGGNPVNMVDPDGRERAGILLDQDNRAFLAGELSQEQLLQRFEDRGKGAIAAVTLLTPGPEELLLAAAGKAFGRAVAGVGGRVGGFFRGLQKTADDIPTTGGAAPVRIGQAGEAAVREAVDIGPKVRISVGGRARIPDGLTDSVLSEVKNVKSLSFTQQLRDFATHADKNGLRFDLFVRPTTELSTPLQQAVGDGLINLRLIP